MNSVNIIGNLTKEPTRYDGQNDLIIVSATVAVNRKFKTKDGVEADFIRIKAFGKTAELISNMNKGQKAGYEGRWETGSYKDSTGETVFTNEMVVESITFVEPKINGQGGQQGNQGTNSYQGNSNRSNGQYGGNQGQSQQNRQSQQNYGGFDGIDVDDLDVPF